VEPPPVKDKEKSLEQSPDETKKKGDSGKESSTPAPVSDVVQIKKPLKKP